MCECACECVTGELGHSPSLGAPRTWRGAGGLAECLGPGGDGLHGPRLPGRQLPEAGLSAVEHLLGALLLLEDLLHMFLEGYRGLCSGRGCWPVGRS